MPENHLAGASDVASGTATAAVPCASFEQEKLERDAFFETVRRYWGASDQTAMRAYVFFWGATRATNLRLTGPSPELLELADKAAAKRFQQPADGGAQLAADWAATPSDTAPTP